MKNIKKNMKFARPPSARRRRPECHSGHAAARNAHPARPQRRAGCAKPPLRAALGASAVTQLRTGEAAQTPPNGFYGSARATLRPLPLAEGARGATRSRHPDLAALGTARRLPRRLAVVADWLAVSSAAKHDAISPPHGIPGAWIGRRKG